MFKFKFWNFKCSNFKFLKCFRSSHFIATLHSKHIFWDSWDNICSKISALRAPGGDVKKMSISEEDNTFTCLETFQHIQIFSALRAVGGDVEIFRTTFLGGDRDEKIDFRRITSGATWYSKRNFWGAILTKRSIVKV